jgi:hypothetical protein
LTRPQPSQRRDAPDRVRDERFFAGFFSHGASEEGGRDEFDEAAFT